MQDGLALLRQKRVPFVPANKTEEEFIEALQRAVFGIDLCFSGRPPGRVGLKVVVQFERLFLTDAQVRALGVTPVLLETEFIIPHYFHSYTGSMDYMSELAVKGVHALTDDQWALLAPKLPDLRRTDHKGIVPTETRTVLNCLLFQLRTNMPLLSLPPHFGDRTLVYNAMLRLITASNPPSVWWPGSAR